MFRLLLCSITTAAAFSGELRAPASRRTASASAASSIRANAADLGGVSDAWEFDPLEHAARGRRPKLLKTASEYVPAEALAAGNNRLEKLKNAKDGTAAWTEIHELSAKLRSGECTWESLDLDDVDLRLKWAGFFHRPKAAEPRTFMVRLKVPNGIITSTQARVCADLVAPYGDAMGVFDITTRMNLQLRGIALEAASEVVDKVMECGLSTHMSGLDNVRNLVGSPVAGVDPLELIDTRDVCARINAAITGGGRGNPEWANLPRKFNIAVSGSRDDFAHTTVNDLGFQPASHPDAPGAQGFNVVLGGFFSSRRAAEAVPMGTWVPLEQATIFSLGACGASLRRRARPAAPCCRSLTRPPRPAPRRAARSPLVLVPNPPPAAVLEVFRDYGGRGDRQKIRLLYLIEERGMDWFSDTVKAVFARRGGVGLRAAAPPDPTPAHARRDLMGVHAQKQAGKSWVGITCPAGRLSVAEVRALADLADRYAGGEMRLTVEQNVVLANVDNDAVGALLAEGCLHGARLRVEQAPTLMRALVSCTGSEFCGQGLIETKHRAIRVAELLDAELELTQTVRLHWTGCPNSCGQAQVADIGLMGSPAKLLDEATGKKMAVEGVQVFLGGAVGEHPELAVKFESAVPAADEALVPHLRELLISKFGAKPRVAH